MSIEKKIDGFLITNIINIRYCSGFRGSSASILLTKKKNFFLTDFRYKENVEKELAGGGEPRIEWDVLIDKDSRLKTIKRLCRGLNIKNLGFESSVSYEFFKSLSMSGIRLKPLRDTIENLRAVKDREEIPLLMEAIRRAETAFLDVKPYIRQGRKEKEIAIMIEERLKKRGCNHTPFDIIVASGVNSAMPHARATDRKLSAGDFVIIDWGGEAEGYFSDMTRTLLLKGSNISKKREIYDTALRANRASISTVMPGVEARVIDKSARDIIKKAGYGGFFGHGTGHGVGLEVHESPHITWTKKEVIRQNMIFTIEPGIYIPGLGGVRIEDMVLVKEKGCEVLTKLPRKLEIV